MRGTLAVRIGAAVGGAVLLTGLAGCASLPAKPTGYLLVRPTDNNLRTPLEATYLGAEKALLLGPNFGVSLEWVYASDEVDGKVAKDLGLGEGVRAADGHELIFAAIGQDDRFNEGRWGEATDGEAKLEAEVTTGGRTQKLNTVPQPGTLLIASVPKGAPARLTVTDEGRAMSIDLRTGRAQGGLSNLRRQRVDADYSGSGRVATPAGATSLDVDIRVEEATLEPYFPGLGWAKNGRAWLRLSLGQVSSSGLTQLSADDPAVGFFVDPAETFELRAEGARLRPKAGLAFNTMRPAARYVAVIDVPDTFRTGELRITPDGPLFTYRGPSMLTQFTDLSRVPDCGPRKRAVCLDWSRRPRAQAVRLALT